MPIIFPPSETLLLQEQIILWHLIHAVNKLWIFSLKEVLRLNYQMKGVILYVIH